MNKTLLDVLIDLYHSGDLVPVWDGDDRSDFVVDLEVKKGSAVSGFVVKDTIVRWYLSQDLEIVTEATCDNYTQEQIAKHYGNVCQIGSIVKHCLRGLALEWATDSDEWDEAKAHITELENSHD